MTLHRLFRVRECGFWNGAVIFCGEHLRFEAAGTASMFKKICLSVPIL